MADVFSKRKRSAVMAAIRSRGNAATELRLITLMRAHGIILLRYPCFASSYAGHRGYGGQAGWWKGSAGVVGAAEIPD